MPAPETTPTCLYSTLTLDEQLCFALHASASAITGVYMETLDAHGLSYRQYLVLICLLETDGLRIDTLARRLSLHPGTLATIVAEMEAAEMVTRHGAGARGTPETVWLTPRGRASRAVALEARQVVMARLGMSDADIGALRATLVEITNRLRYNTPAVTPPETVEAPLA